MLKIRDYNIINWCHPNEYTIMHGPFLIGAPWYCAWMYWGDLQGLYSISIWAYVSRDVWAGGQTPYKGKAWSRSRCNDCMQHGRGYLLRYSAYLKQQMDASAQEMQRRMGRSRCESENTGTQNRPHQLFFVHCGDHGESQLIRPSWTLVASGFFP